MDSKKVKKTLEETAETLRNNQLKQEYENYTKRIKFETSDLLNKNEWLQAKKTNKELNEWYYGEKKLELNLIKTVVDDMINTYLLEEKKEEIYTKFGLKELEVLLENKE